MFPHGVGNDVRQMAGDVIAAFRGRDSYLIEPTNRNVRRPKDRLAVHCCIGAQEQTQGFGIDVVLGIMKYLVEIADPKENLVCQAR